MKSVLTIHKLNRINSRRPRGKKGWCLCDRIRIGNWEKCPLCHRRNGCKRDRPSVSRRDGYIPE